MNTQPPTTPSTDRRGLELSARPDAACLYREGIDLLLGLAEGAADRFEAALRVDPRFGLAYGALALTRLACGRTDLARGALDDARGALAAIHTTRRERQHLDVIAALAGGDDLGVLERAPRHLREFPEDLVVFACLVVAGQRGGDLSQRAGIERLASELARHLGDDAAFLSLRALALSDLGRIDEALQLALGALQIRPASAPAACVVARVRFARGEHAEGRRLVRGWLARWTPTPAARAELQALEARFDLALGDPRTAARAYERALHPAAAAGVPGAVAAAAALLWGLSLEGRDPPLAWGSVHGRATRVTGGAGAASDLPLALALAGAGDERALDRLAASLQAQACRGHAVASALVPVALGLRAFVAGEYHAAAAHLEIALAGLGGVGGGLGQRPLLEDTLIEALLRAGRPEAADQRLSARLERRPTPRDLTLHERATGARSPRTGRLRVPGDLLADVERTPSTLRAGSRSGPISVAAPLSP